MFLSAIFLPSLFQSMKLVLQLVFGFLVAFILEIRLLRNDRLRFMYLPLLVKVFVIEPTQVIREVPTEVLARYPF
jgi:hypothetical protein